MSRRWRQRQGEDDTHSPPPRRSDARGDVALLSCIPVHRRRRRHARRRKASPPRTWRSRKEYFVLGSPYGQKPPQDPRRIGPAERMQEFKEGFRRVGIGGIRDRAHNRACNTVLETHLRERRTFHLDSQRVGQRCSQRIHLVVDWKQTGRRSRSTRDATAAGARQNAPPMQHVHRQEMPRMLLPARHSVWHRRETRHAQQRHFKARKITATRRDRAASVFHRSRYRLHARRRARRRPRR